MKKEIKNTKILEKTVRPKKAKMLKQVQHDMFVQDDKLGFTLAEVLITLGIIGVVAAMTMPSLIQKYQEKATVTALKNNFAIFSQAFQLALIEKGNLAGWEGFSELAYKNNDEGNHYQNDTNIMTSKVLLDAVSSHLKIVKTCGPKDNSCIDVSEEGGLQADSAVLQNGASFYFHPNRNDRAVLVIDINGQNKGKNKTGIDMFKFFVSDKGVIPFGNETDNYFETDCNKSRNYGGCTAWVIYNENMDYLHCDDLSWNGKHKCSD